MEWPDQWVIDHRKLTKYLLDVGHEVGAAKAKALLRAGFSRSDPMPLASALLEHVRVGSHLTVRNAHGVRFVFEGPLVAPNRIISHFRSVWLVRSGERFARLITAYPFDEGKAAVGKAPTIP